MAKRSRFTRTLKLGGLLVAALTGALVANTLNTQSSQVNPQGITPAAIDRDHLAQTLAAAVRLQTLSHRDTNKTDFAPFTDFRALLKDRFPLAFRALRFELVNEHAMLFTWPGSDSSLKPALFAAHYDVVTAEHGDDKTWTHAPFSGSLSDGYVWGRGALDDKSAIITQLTAIETLLQKGFRPTRTFLFAYGHDEEVGGKSGAAHLSALLAQRGIRPEVLFDEGMPITKGVLNGVSAPVALIGVAEKGYMTLNLSVQGEGGHTSSPPPHSAVGVLAKAITRLEENPMPASLAGPVGLMFNTLAPEMKFAQRVVLSNRWLFSPIVVKQLESRNSTNALIRTTAAATMFEGSTQANVLPVVAKASVNFRIVPGDNVESVINHVRTVINDSRVNIDIEGEAAEPSRVSSTGSPAYGTLATTIREIFPDTLVAPALLIAATDTRHYADLAEDIYRFRPLWIGPDDIPRFHGIDERISTENLEKMSQFYLRLIQNLNG